MSILHTYHVICFISEIAISQYCATTHSCLEIITLITQSGLSTILISRDITDYPALCAKVTASFSVLSDTINAAKSSLLEQHKRKDISAVVEQLQKHECEKLNFTAALHLERLRLNNSELGVGNDADERAAKLLRESIQTLEGKISLTVQSINESIDELRCIAVDEE